MHGVADVALAGLVGGHPKAFETLRVGLAEPGEDGLATEGVTDAEGGQPVACGGSRAAAQQSSSTATSSGSPAVTGSAAPAVAWACAAGAFSAWR